MPVLATNLVSVTWASPPSVQHKHCFALPYTNTVHITQRTVARAPFSSAATPSPAPPPSSPVALLCYGNPLHMLMKSWPHVVVTDNSLQVWHSNNSWSWNQCPVVQSKVSDLYLLLLVETCLYSYIVILLINRYADLQYSILLYCYNYSVLLSCSPATAIYIDIYTHMVLL
jgi:hypothetical protein